MKRIKTYKLFESGKNYDINIVKDMLLDFTDKDVNVRVTDGSWILDKQSVEYVKVIIGRTHGLKFKVEDCLLDVINYLSSCGLVLMKESWFWSDMWQHYQGCPNCLSDDFEDNYGLRGTTRCNRCEYIGPPDRFLLDQWPITIERLELGISEGKSVEQIELLFSKRLSIFLNESFGQDEVDEIKDTVSDMLLELDFQNIHSGVWVISSVIQVELKKAVKDKSSAVLWGDRDENRSFEWSDVKEVIDGVSDYLSQWGFKPYWDEVPKFEVRANWHDGGNMEIVDVDNCGYDTCLYLRWKK